MNTILAPIDDVVAWIITGLFNLLSPVFSGGATWVLTIVLLTVLMRLVMVPLFIKQMHTQRAMTALTPKITEIRKKYKGDRETLNAETMKLYQEAGVNPLMGCLPVVLQMPIFFALFSVLRYIAEYKSGPTLYHLSAATIHSAQTAQIFGVTIKDTFLHATSLHVRVVIALVVVTSMLTTYLTMRQNVKRGIMPTGKDNPMGQSQRMMTYILPLFALTGLYWPFGLVLYWVSTNLWTLGQQFVLLRKYPVGAALPGGGVPTSGSAGRPATALGFTGRTSGKSKPSGGQGPGGGAASSKPKARTEPAEHGTADKTGKPDRTEGSGGAGDKPGGNGQPVADGRAPAGGLKDRKPKPTGAGAVPKGGSANPASSGAGSGHRVPAAGQPAADTGRARGAGPRAGGSAGSDSANGHRPEAGEGGVLRRFGRSRPEPESAGPAVPEAKVVRQQRQRQTRSKRSGKR